MRPRRTATRSGVDTVPGFAGLRRAGRRGTARLARRPARRPGAETDVATPAVTATPLWRRGARYSTEGNRLRQVQTSTRSGPEGSLRHVLVERAAEGERHQRRDVLRPRRSAVSRVRTPVPSPPPGWGLFEADGTQVRQAHRHLLAERRRAVRLRVRSRRRPVHQRGGLPRLRDEQRAADHVVPALRRVPGAAGRLSEHR